MLWRASLVAQMVKNLPAVQETWVWSLGQEDPLEKEWQPTPAFLPREFQEQWSLVSYSPWGHKESDTEKLSLSHLYIMKIQGEYDKYDKQFPQIIHLQNSYFLHFSLVHIMLINIPRDFLL